MYSFQEIGRSSLWFVGSIYLFLRFLGHLVCSTFNSFRAHHPISWSTMAGTIFLSGVRMMIPVIFISSLIGFSLALSLHGIFNKFHLQGSALPATQNTAINKIVPLLIGILLCMQSALNLITARVHRLYHTPQEVMQEYIIPIMIGIIITGLLLYIYVVFAFIASIYITFQVILNLETSEYLLHISNYISVYELFYSISKVLMYCVIVAFTVGYYYYEISIRNISLRKAVSRIMTRGLLFIIFFGTYLNIFNI